MDKKLIEDFDKKERSRKEKRRRKDLSKEKSKKSKNEESDELQPSTSYRDRARERREGLNNDFEHDPDDLKMFNPIDKSSYGGGLLDDDARRLQEVEDSKYLGGDVKHTHLVKGLDFALLEKVKSSQKIAEKAKNDIQGKTHTLGDLGSDSEEEEFRMEAILNATSSGGGKKHILDLEKLKKGQSTEVIECRTALARRILNVLGEKWPDKSELFLPGRMSYIVPIDAEDEDATVTTLVRSKADSSGNDENDSLNVTDIAMDYLMNLLARIRQGESNADTSKKPKEKSWKVGPDALTDYDY